MSAKKKPEKEPKVLSPNTMAGMLALPMHMEIETGCFRIKRVPGGWIYTRGLAGVGLSSTFVPEPQ